MLLRRRSRTRPQIIRKKEFSLRRHLASLFTLAFLTASPAYAVMEDYPSVKLQGLDKSVGRTVTFEAMVGSTIQYGPLFIKIHSCRKAPPIEKPESAAFLQIWEVPPGQEKSQWVFSGWMFASSPALSAMDHPVYDVWVLDCLGREEPNEEAAAAATSEQADQTGLSGAEGAAQSPDVAQETPVDSEAEPLPTDSEAEPLPTDSEAEESGTAGTAPENIPPTQDYPIQGGAAVHTPGETAPILNPADNDGFTAYDLMRQQQGAQTPPQPQPAAPSTPIY